MILLVIHLSIIYQTLNRLTKVQLHTYSDAGLSIGWIAGFEFC
jgi:hypothetical protein